VAIPSGIQVFAWIATIAKGKLRLTVPSLYVLGFLFIFVLGGLTGVMVAVVPFDWQVHDTYFVVAHFHYVLFGGMVFPLFAAFYYWMPMISKKPLSKRLGIWVFGLIFTGFNVTFFPMHATGLLGMPRRVYTYPAGLGWDSLNMVSTIGAFAIAAGVIVLLIDLARNFRFSTDDNAGNIWNAGTLEWLPSGHYSVRSIPIVTSREPLWDQAHLADDVEAGRYYLPGAPTGRRETLITSPIDAQPQHLLQLPGPGWSPLLSAVFTAAFFLLLTGKFVMPAMICGVLAIALMIKWLWATDPGPSHEPVEIGGGITVPVYDTGTSSHSWWAMVVLIVVAAAIFSSLIFSYLFLWTVAPEGWPAADRLPAPPYPLLAAGLLAVSSALIAYASRSLEKSAAWPLRVSLLLAVPLIGAAFGFELYGQLQAELRPTDSGYAAVVYTMVAFQGFYAFVLTLMALYTVARSFRGLLNSKRRATFDNTMLLWHYGVAQALVALALVHGFPRLLG
ncbi:MAG: cbb3-type cytochrome c oxidase subunit I, partial [Burkholderiales bacterium]|nr:cbb3-type cytochrome c oxidase subunit I [Burkholderiales bacterium]